MTPVAKLAKLPLKSFEQGCAYASSDAQVARGIGLTKLGATYTEVPPGKSSCPFHVHHVEEEMFVILAGKGRYRFGTTVYDVEAGDVLGAPCGGPEVAHKLTNTFHDAQVPRDLDQGRHRRVRIPGQRQVRRWNGRRFPIHRPSRRSS